MNTSPVFIGGLDRSGKTYMRFMLDGHPKLAISKRTNLWPNFYNRFGDLVKDRNLDRCFEALANHKHIRSLELDLQHIRREFESGPRTYGRLFALIHEHYASRLGRARWGDQSEMLEEYSSQILAAYPDAKIIHMIRDPRDRHQAIVKKSPRRGGVGVTTARWLYSAALAEQNQKRYLGQYKVVRYETMVTYPEETMRSVCEFIDEQYHPSMIKMEHVSRFAKIITDREDELPSPLNTAYIGRFKDNLPACEIVFIQNLSKHLMELFDYPLEQIRCTLSEYVRFYTINWTVYFLFVFGWRLRNKAVH